MALTIGNWVLVGIVVLFGIGLSLYWGYYEEQILPVVAGFAVTILTCVILIFGFSWWHTNTAEGIRSMKDFTSNMNNGILRENTHYRRRWSRNLSL